MNNPYTYNGNIDFNNIMSTSEMGKFDMNFDINKEEPQKFSSNGGSSAYYQLPEDAVELQDLIEYCNMNFAIGNIFKACFRQNRKSNVDDLYDINKIIWFANREKKRLEKKALKNEKS